jgi:hypothetical protein
VRWPPHFKGCWSHRRVSDCARPLSLWNEVTKSGRGLPHSKTLRGVAPLWRPGSAPPFGASAGVCGGLPTAATPALNLALQSALPPLGNL